VVKVQQPQIAREFLNLKPAVTLHLWLLPSLSLHQKTSGILQLQLERQFQIKLKQDFGRVHATGLVLAKKNCSYAFAGKKRRLSVMRAQRQIEGAGLNSECLLQCLSGMRPVAVFFYRTRAALGNRLIEGAIRIEKGFDHSLPLVAIIGTAAQKFPRPLPHRGRRCRLGISGYVTRIWRSPPACGIAPSSL